MQRPKRKAGGNSGNDNIRALCEEIARTEVAMKVTCRKCGWSGKA
jgi:hypothetical protein